MVPASISSVRQGASIAWDSALRIWHGLQGVWPEQGYTLANLAHSVLTWLKGVPGFLSGLMEALLRKTIGVEVDLRQLGRELLSVWNGWDPSVKVVAFCVLATFLWAIYAPPWNRLAQFPLLPPEPRFPRIWLGLAIAGACLASVGRILIALLYALGVAAACGFFVLYIQAVYDVPFNEKGVAEIARRPWLPAEKIRLSSDEPPLVGYTMSVENGWHVVLRERSRTVRYLRSTDVILMEK